MASPNSYPDWAEDFTAVSNGAAPETSDGYESQTSGFYIATAGDLTVHNKAGASIAFKNLVAGSVIKIKTKYVVTAPADTIALF